jgi:oxygen-independent coproporphyrinogen-3 oxidase
VWQQDVDRALLQLPDHVSTYGLTFERGARFLGRQRRGELTPVAEEDQRTMYETAIERLQTTGFEHYEVSNFARPGHRCRHNEVYWSCREYYAAGPGAARFVAGVREQNHRSTFTYVKRVLAGRSPVVARERLGPEDAARERLVFGLRMIEGIHCVHFEEQTGYHPTQLGGAALKDFLARGWLEMDGPHLRLTREGLMISDSLWPELLRV